MPENSVLDFLDFLTVSRSNSGFDHAIYNSNSSFKHTCMGGRKVCEQGKNLNMMHMDNMLAKFTSLNKSSVKVS